MGKGKEMFTTDKKYTRCKRLVCHVALEYCLKDLPCCTEWIDVYLRFNMDKYGAITCLYKCIQNSSFKNRDKDIYFVICIHLVDFTGPGQVLIILT